MHVNVCGSLGMIMHVPLRVKLSAAFDGAVMI